MHGAKGRAVAFVLAGLFVGIAGTAERAAAGGQVAARPSAAAQGLEATPESVIFENVPVGELYTQPVRISNLSSSRVQITQIVSSNADFAISGVTVPVELQSGANIMFTVAYKPKAARNIAAKITIVTDAGAAVEMDVKASSMSKQLGFAASATRVEFGAVPIGKNETKEITLANGGNAEVTISKISVRGENFSVAGGNGLKLSPGQKTNVQVHFDPRDNGSRTGVVSIFSNAQRAPLQIALSGRGAAMSGQSVELKWQKNATSASGYNVYRSSDQGGSYTKLDSSPVTGSSYTDTGLAAGQTYIYMIKSVDANNNESEESEQITVSVPRE